MNTTSGTGFLLFKYLRGDLSAEERARLQAWRREDPQHQAFFDEVTQPGHAFAEAMEKDQIVQELNLEEAWQKLVKRGGVPRPAAAPALTHRIILYRYAAAIALVLMLCAGIYLWKQPGNDRTTAVTDTTVQAADIMPANGEVILVLDDGRRLLIDSSGNGRIGSDGGKDIVKEQGQLSYAGSSSEVAYNTLVTTKGKMMSVVLADGSTVWLNAASSLRFPTAFPGEERVVELEGEGYFDIAKNTAQPFRVKVRKETGESCEIAVTGTKFVANGHAGGNEIATTLVEGAVNLQSGNFNKALRPGQQGAVRADGIRVASVDTDVFTAWKDRNFFYFKNNDIQSIARQLETWYDITVKVEGNLSGRTFSGQINRAFSLKAVMAMFEQANVRYEVNGKVLTIK